MISKLLAVMFFWILFVSVAAAELRDPTRPPGYILGETAVISVWQLDAIIIAKDRKVAIINGQSVTIGEKISGNELINIDANNVQLQGTDGKMTLFLLDTSLKKDLS